MDTERARWLRLVTLGLALLLTVVRCTPDITAEDAGLLAPSELVAVPVTSGQVDLVWSDNSSDEIGFIVERRVENGSFEPRVRLSANVTSFSDEVVAPDRAYEYRIIAEFRLVDAQIVRSIPSNVAGARTSPAYSRQIIADHSVVDRYALIPQRYLDQVKTMWFNALGESHSLGYRKGLALLMAQDPRFSVGVTEGGPPEGPTTEHLRVNRASRGARTVANMWIHSYGEEDFYVDAVALNTTKNHIAYCHQNNLALSVIAFVWCWDMLWHNPPGGELDPVHGVHWAGSSVGGPDGDRRWGLDEGDMALTGNRVTMNTYLSAVDEYNAYSRANGFGTRVVFTTGPYDYSGETAYQAFLKHEYIRAHVGADRARILLDYADILCYDDQGNGMTMSWNGHTFQRIHPNNMLDLNGTYVEDGDHIGERGALRLAKASWWLLARIAGWDGISTD